LVGKNARFPTSLAKKMTGILSTVARRVASGVIFMLLLVGSPYLTVYPDLQIGRIPLTALSRNIQCPAE
jgi:hypothetical protein